MAKKNDKSCLFDAAQMLVTPLNLYEFVDHDGSERGFHTEELADALMASAGIRLLKHELYPCLQLPGGKIVPIFTKEKAVERFERFLDSCVTGVLICRKPSGVHHAYAYDLGTVLDTDGSIVKIEDLDIVMLLEFC
jgi:hypothetical protein